MAATGEIQRPPLGRNRWPLTDAHMCRFYVKKLMGGAVFL
jgi:hypothetical protein